MRVLVVVAYRGRQRVEVGGVLQDRQILSPLGGLAFGPKTQQKIKPVVGAYGDAIIAERNFGGAMVAETLRHADPNIPIREVVASRGKMVRGRLALLSRAFDFIST